jgi:hypothetical protein
MCRRIDCAKCGRPSYAGCGAHVEQVLASVPPAERCCCGEAKAKAKAKEAKPEGRKEPRSWLRDLLGR